MPSEPEALAHLRPVSSRHSELPIYRLGDEGDDKALPVL